VCVSRTASIYVAVYCSMLQCVAVCCSVDVGAYVCVEMYVCGMTYEDAHGRVLVQL